jgi:ribosomal protein S18 acetylase RimI-like enzyme
MANAPRVGLVALSSLECADFIERQIVEYADQKTRAGHWRSEEAIARSREAMKDFLPGRPPGHGFYQGVDPAGRRVGWVWLGPPPKELRLMNARWLFQITVEETLRGQGYGRALLAAAEDQAAADGADALYLNVFAWNVAAKALYDSAGYVVHYDGGTEFGMHKQLIRRLPSW